MESSNDEQIQRALEDKLPITKTEASEVYQRLFLELQRAPSIQPDLSFSRRVVAEVERQEAKRKNRTLLVGISIGLFLCTLLAVSLSIGQQTVWVTLHAIGMAKGWLLVGLGCLIVFLVLEHRFMSRNILSRWSKAM